MTNLPARLTSTLAFDIASKLLSTDELLEKHGLTASELKSIVALPEFRRLYAEAKLTWESDIDQRLELKASMSLEDHLLTLHAMANDVGVDPQDRLNAVKLLAQVSGKAGSRAGSSGSGSTAGERVVININVPDPADPAANRGITVEGVALPDAPDAPADTPADTSQ